MSEKDKLHQRVLLNEALKHSFKKMLELKKKMGLPIVTSDGNGNAIIITAEEAEKLVSND